MQLGRHSPHIPFGQVVSEKIIISGEQKLIFQVLICQSKICNEYKVPVSANCCTVLVLRLIEMQAAEIPCGILTLLYFDVSNR